jgi:hypothetical protein
VHCFSVPIQFDLLLSFHCPPNPEKLSRDTARVACVNLDDWCPLKPNRVFDIVGICTVTSPILIKLSVVICYVLVDKTQLMEVWSIEIRISPFFLGAPVGVPVRKRKKSIDPMDDSGSDPDRDRPICNETQCGFQRHCRPHHLIIERFVEPVYPIRSSFVVRYELGE